MSQTYPKDSTYFETICCKEGKPLHLKYHTKRIMETIQKDLQLLKKIIPPNKNLLRCKVIYNKNGIEDISYYPYQKRVLKRFKIVCDDSIQYSYKYLNRSQLDKLFEKRGDCDEVLIFKNGYLTDTTIANVAIYKEGIWFTPKTPLLKGTTKTRLLEEDKIQEAHITLDALLVSKKIALMNAMIDFDILDEFEIIL